MVQGGELSCFIINPMLVNGPEVLYRIEDSGEEGAEVIILSSVMHLLASQAVVYLDVCDEAFSCIRSWPSC